MFASHCGLGEILHLVFWFSTVSLSVSIYMVWSRNTTFIFLTVMMKIMGWNRFCSDHSASLCYRFKCQSSGVFQCTLTGLVFVMTREAELLYRTVQWDENLLQPAKKTPAGPLFSIKCSEDAVCQLHLPHCETMEGKHGAAATEPLNCKKLWQCGMLYVRNHVTEIIIDSN